MYMFKLMKRGSQYENSQHQHRGAPESPMVRRGSSSSGVTFFGQELDSLLYVSMEDQDGRVREEARKALKCLGHYGQQRLNQMERSRMGFMGNDSPTGSSPMANARIQAGPKTSSSAIRGSMPNLNRI